MMPPIADTNIAHWHTIIVMPLTNHAKIHFYNKINPIWWFGNIDDPVPPPDYRPHSKYRVFLWRLRNPFHNSDFYVIGIADKQFKRSGRYPDRVGSPQGGWSFAVTRRKLAVLPFIFYQHGRFTFYFGWRDRGDFGIKLNYSAPPHKHVQAVQSGA